jgi:hypothetical protein
MSPRTTERHREVRAEAARLKAAEGLIDTETAAIFGVKRHTFLAQMVVSPGCCPGSVRPAPMYTTSK